MFTELSDKLKSYPRFAVNPIGAAEVMFMAKQGRHLSEDETRKIIRLLETTDMTTAEAAAGATAKTAVTAATAAAASVSGASCGKSDHNDRRCCSEKP